MLCRNIFSQSNALIVLFTDNAIKLSYFKCSFRTYEGGLGASPVMGLVNFSPRTLDLRLNCTGFRVLRCVMGCGLGHFWCLSFGDFVQNSHFF